MRTLVRMHTEYRANVLFNFFVATLLGVTEQVQVAKFTGGKQGADGDLGQTPGLQSVAQEGWLGMPRWCVICGE
jgi:hypothetical protein